jgi:hypothetical protein
MRINNSARLLNKSTFSPLKIPKTYVSAIKNSNDEQYNFRTTTDEKLAIKLKNLANASSDFVLASYLATLKLSGVENPEKFFPTNILEKTDELSHQLKIIKDKIKEDNLWKATENFSEKFYDLSSASAKATWDISGLPKPEEILKAAWTFTQAGVAVSAIAAGSIFLKGFLDTVYYLGIDSSIKYSGKQSEDSWAKEEIKSDVVGSDKSSAENIQ